jgi:hypothetical protein
LPHAIRLRIGVKRRGPLLSARVASVVRTPEYADESLSIASMEEGGKQGSYIVGMLRLVRRGSCLNETGSRVERCEGGLARDAHQSALPKSGVPFSTRMFASAQPERDHLRCIGAAPLCKDMNMQFVGDGIREK